GILQFTEVISNIMVLICVVASQVVTAGYTSVGGFGTAGFSINSAYSIFQGEELKQVRELDMKYSQMRAPGVYGGVAFSLAMGAITLLFLATGTKPLHRTSLRVLKAELVFDVLACVGYIIAVGLYLHFIIKVNSTDDCKLRERMYAARGYNWMNCEVQGGDAAVALFGLILACLYCASTVICVLNIRTLKHLRDDYRERRSQDFHEPFLGPLGNEIYV
uniref:Si:ch211-191a24.4 n=1 Tax=Latimeria chalumnae TaxID=7897 RepID=H3A964_LATCH